MVIIAPVLEYLIMLLIDCAGNRTDFVFVDVGVCVHGAGAPQPLEPELVTLSLLPRSQWQTLVHLDAIKVLHASSCLAA